MQIITVAQMLSLEKKANANGLSYAEMIQTAGKGLANEIMRRYGHLENKTILGLIGSGNNGGDTLVAMTRLIEKGWNCTAYTVKPRPAKDELLQTFQILGGKLIIESDDSELIILKNKVEGSSILLDGVLGTGIHLPLSGRLAQVLKTVSNLPDLPVIIAVDCPSGIDCVTGKVAAECIPADLTVCMEAIKSGLLRFPAFAYVGEFSIIPIGLSFLINDRNEKSDQVIDKELVRRLIPSRPMDAHKGTFGTAMIVAGSINYTGAVLLAGKAACRVGAGLIRLAVSSVIYPTLAGQLPEATWLLLPHEEGAISFDAIKIIKKYLDKTTALLLGSGWGTEETTRLFLEALLKIKTGKTGRKAMGFVTSKTDHDNEIMNLPRLVIDADGLRLLAQIPHWEEFLPGDCVLTPHPGEMSALCGLTIDEIQSDRWEIARKFALQWHQVLVLKGALTVIASPMGDIFIVPVASSALAHAGTGDVLAGMITGLIAQGLSPLNAAIAGAWIHAQAGLYAVKRIGSEASVIAGDVIKAIPYVYRSLGNKSQRL